MSHPPRVDSDNAELGATTDGTTPGETAGTVGNWNAGSIGVNVPAGNPGITVSAVSVLNATQIIASFTIDPAAAPGVSNVAVTTRAATCNPATFTVAAAPSIASVSPTTATGGTQVTNWKPAHPRVFLASSATTLLLLLLVEAISDAGAAFHVWRSPTMYGGIHMTLVFLKVMIPMSFLAGVLALVRDSLRT